jgi:chromosome segregation ATPase
MHQDTIDKLRAELQIANDGLKATADHRARVEAERDALREALMGKPVILSEWEKLLAERDEAREKLKEKGRVFSENLLMQGEEITRLRAEVERLRAEKPCQMCQNKILELGNEVERLQQLAEIRLQESMRQEMAKEEAEAEATFLRGQYNEAEEKRGRAEAALRGVLRLVDHEHFAKHPAFIEAYRSVSIEARKEVKP